MATTNFRSAIKSGRPSIDAGDVLLMQVAEVSFTAATDESFEVFTLPQGARVVDFLVREGSVTVTNASINIGTSATADYFVDELVLSGDTSAVQGGTLNTGGFDVELASPTAVFVGIGDTNATDGSATIVCIYARTNADFQS